MQKCHVSAYLYQTSFRRNRFGQRYPITHNRLSWAQFLHWQKMKGARVAHNRKINQNRIKYSSRDRNSWNGIESSRKFEEIVLSPQPHLISHQPSHHLPSFDCIAGILVFNEFRVGCAWARVCMRTIGTSDLNIRYARSARLYAVETCVLHEWIA